MEARVEATGLLEALAGALNADGDLLEESELQEIETRVADLEATRQQADPQQIHHAIEALGKVTEAFAARRMDASIKQALAGHSIDELSESE